MNPSEGDRIADVLRAAGSRWPDWSPAGIPESREAPRAGELRHRPAPARATVRSQATDWCSRSDGRRATPYFGWAPTPRSSAPATSFCRAADRGGRGPDAPRAGVNDEPEEADPSRRRAGRVRLPVRGRGRARPRDRPGTRVGRSSEILKRYTTATMGPCQGAAVRAAPRRVRARAKGAGSRPASRTTARPPARTAAGVIWPAGSTKSVEQRTALHDRPPRGRARGSTGPACGSRPGTYGDVARGDPRGARAREPDGCRHRSASSSSPVETPRCS